MRVVLYTDDLEPITVLKLEPWALEFLRERGRVYFAVMRPIPIRPLRGDEPIDEPGMWQVCIHAEKLIRKGIEHLLLITYDEEQALLLKSAFLPGQTAALNERDRNAWAKGFIDALHFAAK